MIRQLIKFYNNKTISNIQLVGLMDYTDYVGIKLVETKSDYNVYLVELKNANYFVVKVATND